MKIGIDIMGGDYAPEKIIHGTILASKELSDNDLILFGEKQKILSEIKKYNVQETNFEIIDCSEIIQMGEHPVKAFKNKPESSISKGFKYLNENLIDGFASCGNTGAMYVGGYYSVKAISGVLRPCISALIPQQNGGTTILLDVGANADCKADVLYQFGILGSIFAEYVCGIKNPKVSLLNLGEEASKGNMLTQSSFVMMNETKDFNFTGNIESRDIFNGKTDVIICDGFTGNIVLKQAEAFYDIIKKKNIKDSFFERFNYENYGGTPILGLNKPVIIGHGISNEIAVKNMILLTKDIINADLTNKITNMLK